MRHPAFYELARLHTRRALEDAGIASAKVHSAMSGCDNDLIDVAADEANTGPEVRQLDKVGAIGDGSILKAIVAFFQSDLGKAIVKILMTLLMTLIAV